MVANDWAAQGAFVPAVMGIDLFIPEHSIFFSHQKLLNSSGP